MEKKSLPDPDDIDSGTWIVGIPAGPRSIIGKVVLVDGKGAPTDNAKAREWSIDEVCAARWVMLYPSFDFLIQQRQIPIRGEDGKPKIDPQTGVPEIGVERAPYVNSLDFTLHPTPFMLNVSQLVAFYSFSQMHKQDQEQYRLFVKQAVSNQTRYRRAQSPLVTPSDEERRRLAR